MDSEQYKQMANSKLNDKNTYQKGCGCWEDAVKRKIFKKTQKHFHKARN